jgi:hypothetical protein
MATPGQLYGPMGGAPVAVNSAAQQKKTAYGKSLGSAFSPQMHDYFSGLSPQAQLAFLMSNGYQVDGGTRGTQFRTASKAYGKGIGGAYWTKVANANEKTRLAAARQATIEAAAVAASTRAAKAHHAAMGAHDPNAVAPMAPDPLGGVSGSDVIDTSAINMPSLKSLGINLKGLNYKGMDPTKLATSMVNAQYDPQITDLASHLTTAQNQGTQDQTDIKAWYDALASDLADTTASDTKAQTAALADHDAGQAGILNVLGGNAGAANSASAFGAINRGELEKIGLSRKQYDDALAPAFTSQRNDAALSQLNRDRTAQEDLLSQLTAARTAKGQAFAGAYSQAADDAFKNQVASVNAKAQLSMLPSQLATARQNVAQGNASLKLAGLNYDAQLLKNQVLGQQASGPVPVFGSLNPEQLTGLQNQLLSQAVDSKDPLKLAHNPMDVYKAWGSALRSMSGGKWNPQTSAMVDKWRNGLLASRLPQWNRTHPKQQFAFRNGVLVKKK